MKTEAPPFINRQSELALFKQKAEEIAQGQGEDLFFISPWGRGKTALLKKLKEILLWGQKEVIPVYFSFSRDYIDLLDFAEEYLVSVLSQCLLFEQKERINTLRPSPFSFVDLQKEAVRQGKGIIEEIILAHQRAVKNQDHRKGLFNAFGAPGRIAQAVNKPVWMMVDHIQAIENVTLNGKGVAGLWRDTIASPWAPHLFSGEPPGYLLKNLLPAFGPPHIPVMELPPLPIDDGELTSFLEKHFKVKLAGDLSQNWFHYLEGNLGLLTPLLREARLEAPQLESHQRFVELYLKSLWQGELGRIFENRLYDRNKIDLSAGSLFLKILYRLFKSEEPVFSTADLEKTIDEPQETVQASMRFLERAGLIWERFGQIGLENDRVTKDWVEVLVRKQLFREDLDQVIQHWGKGIEENLSKVKEETSSPPNDNTLHFNLVLPINSETELVAVRALEQIATYSNLDEGSIEKVKLALIEACINAAEHSQSFEKKIRIYFSVQPEAIEVLVEDRGQAFDPVAVQARIVQETDPLVKKRGRGFVLIRELMDEVRFEKTDIGTRVYMMKKTNKRA